MDTSSTVPTQVLGQTSVTVSLDTNALIAARQGAAWKVSGWPENITIHHAKGCACCHEYINHLLGAQSLGQINLQHINIENADQSAWPAFINSIKIDADQCIQGQLSDLHAQIDELKDTLCDAKKSYCNTEAALTKEHSWVKDLEQELKDLKSHSQVEANASARGWALTPTLISKRDESRLGSHITMEVDDEYKWMEEAGYKLVDGPLPVSKRQQKKGLGPSVYISAFNSIEALEKNYLAQLPSHSLTDPALH